MDFTKVKKSDLLETLRNNRAAHEKEFKSAKKTWLREAKKALRKAADNAENNDKIDFSPLSELPKPTHYLDSYDVMISRLEFEVEDEVELDEREFKAYVLDDWNWKNQFVGTTSIYNR